MDEQPPAHRANPADVPHTSAFWLVSPRDEQLHCFEALGEPAEAICTHSVPARLLMPDNEDRPAPRCHRCLQKLGDELIRRGQIGERDRWGQ